LHIFLANHWSTMSAGFLLWFNLFNFFINLAVVLIHATLKHEI
jgi:hypothetical protein